MTTTKRAAGGKRSAEGSQRKPRTHAVGAAAKKGTQSVGGDKSRNRPAARSRDETEVVILLIDKNMLEWYRAQSPRWRVRMNAVLRAFRDATI